MAYVAVEAGTSLNVQAGRTSDRVSEEWALISLERQIDVQPAFLAAIQTFDGTDTSTLRHRSLSSSGVEVFVEEEQSADDEVVHVTEVVGYLALTPGPLGVGPETTASVATTAEATPGALATAAVPTEPSLEAAFPNPSRGRVAVRFGLSEPADVPPRRVRRARP